MKRAAVVLVIGVLLGLLVNASWQRPAQAKTESPTLSDRQKQAERTKWVSDSLMEMRTIKVGMTRAQLLKVFTHEGGIYTALQQTFVYRGCPYFKVDVKFTPVGRPERDRDGRMTSVQDPRDVIKEISRPYLEFSIVD